MWGVVTHCLLWFFFCLRWRSSMLIVPKCLLLLLYCGKWLSMPAQIFSIPPTHPQPSRSHCIAKLSQLPKKLSCYASLPFVQTFHSCIPSTPLLHTFHSCTPSPHAPALEGSTLRVQHADKSNTPSSEDSAHTCSHQ